MTAVPPDLTKSHRSCYCPVGDVQNRRHNKRLESAKVLLREPLLHEYAVSGKQDLKWRISTEFSRKVE